MTKHRHPDLTDTHLKRMEGITYAMCTDYECELTEFNGENNPRPPPRDPPAPDRPVQKLVNSLKDVSSRSLR